MIIALFAVDDNGSMGSNGAMPWPPNRDDFKWFKATTTGQVVVMGRKTWESPDMPKPLPNRTNVVVSTAPIDNDAVIQINGDVCKELIELQSKFSSQNIFVIGGAFLLNQVKPVLEKMLITRIPGTYPRDVSLDIESFVNGFTLTNQNNLGSCTVETYERI